MATCSLGSAAFLYTNIAQESLLREWYLLPMVGWDHPISINLRQSPADMPTGQPYIDIETVFLG